MIKILAGHPDINLEDKNYLGETPLFLAVKLNHINAISYILEAIEENEKKEVLLISNKEGLLPIHQAAKNNKSNFVQILKSKALKLGIAESKLVTSSGETVESFMEVHKKALKAELL